MTARPRPRPAAPPANARSRVSACHDRTAPGRCRGRTLLRTEDRGRNACGRGGSGRRRCPARTGRSGALRGPHRHNGWAALSSPATAADQCQDTLSRRSSTACRTAGSLPYPAIRCRNFAVRPGGTVPRMSTARLTARTAPSISPSARRASTTSSSHTAVWGDGTAPTADSESVNRSKCRAASRDRPRRSAVWPRATVTARWKAMPAAPSPEPASVPPETSSAGARDTGTIAPTTLSESTGRTRTGPAGTIHRAEPPAGVLRHVPAVPVAGGRRSPRTRRSCCLRSDPTAFFDRGAGRDRVACCPGCRSRVLGCPREP
ncbi:hypothetical protein SAMN05216371_8178 [Streptomyces sp. TLI_053]|nr:hypothetical protein SAMN05216371_8178 [Streptomyces sp. TLI_053]